MAIKRGSAKYDNLYGSLDTSTSSPAILADEARLLRLGYKQELQRKLSSFATFGLSFANIGILANTSATFQTVLQRGGPMIMLVTWNGVAVFMACIALALGEICSMYATSGGLYYWAYQLLQSHPRFSNRAPFLAFMVGWIYSLGCVIAFGANNVIVALSVGSLIELAFGYQVGQIDIMWIAVAVTVIHGILNTFNLRSLAILNVSNVAWAFGGLIYVILVLSIGTEHRQSLEWILTDYENRTGFSSPIYVVLLGMVGAAYSQFGFEAGVTVSEETKEADVSAPLAMIMSLVASWFVGLVFLIVLLFSIQDIDAILDSKLDFPVSQLIWDAVGVYGTFGFLVLVTMSQFCTGAATLTTVSRMVYALARDRAVPKNEWLRKINAYQLPGNAVCCVVVITCICVIGPFPLSEDVFEIIVSATTITIHFAFALVLGCRLAARGYSDKGRFSLGCMSVPVTAIAFCWAIVAVCVFTLPTSYPIQVSTMNFSGVAFLGVLMTTWTCWRLWGIYQYRGPQAQNDEE
ncbi:hypothetical protein VTP01DRAFT_1896 [Rhizomucor pusillus]|uniref:uncharacterized protein n=1 Tax=Rhizomucor pusillus TaxID=4840 RepID=UPI0037442DB2